MEMNPETVNQWTPFVAYMIGGLIFALSIAGIADGIMVGLGIMMVGYLFERFIQ